MKVLHCAFVVSRETIHTNLGELITLTAFLNVNEMNETYNYTFHIYCSTSIIHYIMALEMESVLLFFVFIFKNQVKLVSMIYDQFT